VQEYEFWWDDDNVDHIANHGVEPYEAEQVLANQAWIRRTSGGKYLAYGQTVSGRFLLVVFAPKPGTRLRVVTAREMTPMERRRYRNR
jgi:uncharacterized DUF497 family protein